MSGITKFFLSAALPILSFCAFAQSAASIPARSILVNVLDRSGNAVRDLTNNNFRVKVNGRPAAISGASYSLAPRRIVVLLDMSGSMGGEKDGKKWQIAREAVQDFPIKSTTFSPFPSGPQFPDGCKKHQVNAVAFADIRRCGTRFRRV